MGVDGQMETQVLRLSRANEPLVHAGLHSIVNGLAYRFGVDGHTFTQVFVEGSLYKLEAHVEVQRRVVLSANKVSGQTK